MRKFETLSKEEKKKIYSYFDQQLPLEASATEKLFLKKSKKFTMTGNLRMYSIIYSFKHVINNKIPGDFVECGVWKGGNLILLKNLLEYYKIKKKNLWI